jgi:O-antigen ligase
MRLADPVGWPLPMEDERLHRFAGSIGNPNAAGVIYAMLSLIAVAVGCRSFARWRHRAGDGRLLAALAELGVALVGCALVGITQSRTALALLVAGLALQLATGTAARKSRRKWRVAGAIAAALALAVAAAGTLDRFAPVEADGVGRGAIWGYYLALAGKAPLNGHGLGSFVELNQRQLTPASAPTVWSFGAAHAAPVQLALETGWPGLALLAGVVALVLGRIIRRLRPAADPVGLAMLLAVLVAVLAGMVDIALNVPGIAMLASILAGLSWGRALRGGGWREGL